MVSADRFAEQREQVPIALGVALVVFDSWRRQHRNFSLFEPRHKGPSDRSVSAWALAHGSRRFGPNADFVPRERCVMRSRSKIASIVLFLAALAVGFDAQPGWSLFTHLVSGYLQCDVAT